MQLHSGRWQNPVSRAPTMRCKIPHAWSLFQLVVYLTTQPLFPATSPSEQLVNIFFFPSQPTGGWRSKPSYSTIWNPSLLILVSVYITTFKDHFNSLSLYANKCLDSPPMDNYILISASSPNGLTVSVNTSRDHIIHRVMMLRRWAACSGCVTQLCGIEGLTQALEMPAQVMHVDNRPDSWPHNAAVHARGRICWHLAHSPELAKRKSPPPVVFLFEQNHEHLRHIRQMKTQLLPQELYSLFQTAHSIL